MPSRTEILKADLMDTATSVPQLAEHFGGGVVKSVVDLNKLLRSVNPLDPYNITHPAEYATGLSGLVAGLSTSANNPTEAVKGLVGSGWGSDPAEAGGKLFGNLLLTPETGGGSAAATAAEREATAVAENAAKNTAKEAAEKAAKEAAEKAAKEAAEKAAKEAADKAAVSAKPPMPAPTHPASLPEGWNVKSPAQEAADTTAASAKSVPSQQVPHPLQPAPHPSPTPTPQPEFKTGPVKPESAHPSIKSAEEAGVAHEANTTSAGATNHSHPVDHSGPTGHDGTAGQSVDHSSVPADASDASPVAKHVEGGAAPGSGPHMTPEEFSRLTPEDQMKVAWSETSQGRRLSRTTLKLSTMAPITGITTPKASLNRRRRQ